MAQERELERKRQELHENPEPMEEQKLKDLAEENKAAKAEYLEQKRRLDEQEDTIMLEEVDLDEGNDANDPGSEHVTAAQGTEDKPINLNSPKSIPP